MEININQLTAAEYLDAVVNAGMGGYTTLLRDMGERKTRCDSPMLWLGSQSCTGELLDHLDYFMSVAEAVAKDISDDDKALKNK